MANYKYVKMPVEMALSAIRNGSIPECKCFLTIIICYSGKIKINSKNVANLANKLEVGKRSIYRYLKALEERSWVFRNHKNGWIFTNSIDHVHSLEKWEHSRAVAIYKEDLKFIKEFFYATVFTSLLKTGSGQQSGRKLRGPKNIAGHLSLNVIVNVLNISESTAFRFRKKAAHQRYIKNTQVSRRVKSISPIDLITMRFENIEYLKIKCFGSPDTIRVPIKRLFITEKEVHLQLPNYIESKLLIRYRKGCNRFISNEGKLC